MRNPWSVAAPIACLAYAIFMLMFLFERHWWLGVFYMWHGSFVEQRFLIIKHVQAMRDKSDESLWGSEERFLEQRIWIILLWDYVGHCGISCNAWNDSLVGSLSNDESFMFSKKVMTSASANARASSIAQRLTDVLQSFHAFFQNRHWKRCVAFNVS